MRDIDIPISYLHECFIHRKDGVLVWRERPLEHFKDRRAWAIWNTRYSGIEAGAPIKTGYIRVTMSDHRTQMHRLSVYAHRIVWAMAMDMWFPGEIDHKDGNPTNNRFSNLREAPDDSSQMQNMRLRKDNTSGYIGVSWNHGAWRARLNVHGENVYSGRFTTRKAARAAYLAAKKIHHPFQPVPRS